MQTFILGFWPDYETYFFEASCQELDTLKIFHPPMPPWVQKVIPKFLYRPYYRASIKGLFQTYPHAHFICNENISLIKSILKYKQSHKIHLLFRNPVQSKPNLIPYITLLKAHNIKLWSFDQQDCQSYGMHFHEQFISPIPKLKNTEISHNFSFIGREKNRTEQLNQLAVLLKSSQLSYNYHIVLPSQPPLCYEDYLKVSLSGECLIDIMQAHQSGMTLRPIEAAFYQRKLLTNNKRILTHPLYRPENILVFDESLSSEQLLSFIKKPYQTYSPKTLKVFQSQHILKLITENGDIPKSLKQNKN